VLNDELTETLLPDRPPVTGLKTMDGLLEVIENAVAIMAVGWQKGKRCQVAQAPCPAAVPLCRCFAFRLLRRRWEHRQLADIARVMLDDDRGLEVGGDFLEAIQRA
jgi:hypothetical protein